MYYYRSVPAVNPIAFGIDVNDIIRLTNNNVDLINNISSSDDDEIINDDIYNNENNNDNNYNNIISNKFFDILSKKTSGHQIEECLVCGS